MTTTVFYCPECKRTRSVELRIPRAIDMTNFHDEPRSTIIKGIQTVFTCGHTATVWDAQFEGIGQPIN